MKTIKSKYAVINRDTIKLLDKRISIRPISQELFKNVTINFIDNNCIEIIGDLIIFNFSLDGFFVDKNTKVAEKEIIQKFNLFKFKKMPYVKYGWHELKETKRVSIIKNIFEIIQ